MSSPPLVQKVKRPSKPAAPCSTHGGRATDIAPPPRGQSERKKRGPARVPVERRHECQTDASGGPDACHPWVGYVTNRGYGALVVRTDGKQKFTLAHHVALLRDGRPLPAGALTRHLCGNKRCQNPRHLEIGTPAENVADSLNHGTFARGERMPHAKLTAAKVREIHAAAAGGEVSNSSIARRFGITEARVRQILSGEGWPHLHPSKIAVGAPSSASQEAA